MLVDFEVPFGMKFPDDSSFAGKYTTQRWLGLCHPWIEAAAELRSPAKPSECWPSRKLIGVPI
jgi:hypothetical protein